MGLEIVVGILTELRDWDWERYEIYTDQFALLNLYLEQIGLPIHEEPETCETWSCDMYGYSGLHYLRRLAAHIALKGKLPTPGNKASSDDPVLQRYYSLEGIQENGLVKRSSENLIEFNFGFDHLIFHSDCNGFYLPYDFENVLYPYHQLEIIGNEVGSSVKLLKECESLASVLEIPSNLNENFEELALASDLQGEGDDRWERYGVESFTCVGLIKACQKSIENKAAIVFS